MAVILGNSGHVELRRISVDGNFRSVINAADVDAAANRFSFDFPNGMLLTGDRIDIKSTNNTVLSFVVGWTETQGSWYVHVDYTGGLRLYDTFDDAVNGEAHGRVNLKNPAGPLPVEVDIVDNNYQCVAQVQSFELNTERSAVDVTELGEEFRQQHSTLISGSGTLNCLFEYQRLLCDGLNPLRVELPVYFHQLLLRLQLGSGFKAQLYLISRNSNPADREDQVWYEFDAFVTNVGIAFEPTQAVQSTIQFVTTGEIKLLTRTSNNYLLQEDFDRLELERDQEGGFLEVEQRED